MKIFQGEELPQPKSMLLVRFVAWSSTSFLRLSKKVGKRSEEKGEMSRKSRILFWYSNIFPTFVP